MKREFLSNGKDYYLYATGANIFQRACLNKHLEDMKAGWKCTKIKGLSVFKHLKTGEIQTVLLYRNGVLR